MGEATLSILYCPFPTHDSARVAAYALLEQHAVACCNLLPGVESHYRWEGVLTTETEIVLIAKTTAEKLAQAREILAQNHPYDCPAILSFSAVSNADYALWVAHGVAGASQRLT